MISGLHSAAGEDYDSMMLCWLVTTEAEIEVASSSETYVLIYQLTWCHNPEDCIIL
jgi:hypothetical protein